MASDQAALQQTWGAELGRELRNWLTARFRIPRTAAHGRNSSSRVSSLLAQISSSHALIGVIRPHPILLPALSIDLAFASDSNYLLGPLMERTRRLGWLINETKFPTLGSLPGMGEFRGLTKSLCTWPFLQSCWSPCSLEPSSSNRCQEGTGMVGKIDPDFHGLLVQVMPWPQQRPRVRRARFQYTPGAS